MLILPLTSPEATLAVAGGKGTNLARLARLGFPVPPGFILTTGAYRRFVDENELQPVVQAALAMLPPEPESAAGPREGWGEALEATSAHIRAAFCKGVLPARIETDIHEAYQALINHSAPADKLLPVAVRSSATAEDLPDLSFAGQQDTYLNILGEGALLAAVIRCWGSLWTARAIGYRRRNGIRQDEIALAVVVQAMVSADVSGVLFTANPLSGRLDEMVIDAVFGLGEALVSGQVEPDHYLVEAASGASRTMRLGSKTISTRGKTGGGVETIPEADPTRQTLSEAQLGQLAALGRRVEAEYGAPQDIEWALAGGELTLLQSRAITSLFPVPEVSFDPLQVWFSFGAVQGLVGPITPLGRDTIRCVAAGGGKMFGLQLKPEELKLFVTAGERIWIRISDVMRNPLGRRLIGPALAFVEPSVGQIIKGLAEDPRLGAGRGRIRLSTLRRIAHFVLPVAAKMLTTMLQPEKARARFDADIDAYLAGAEQWGQQPERSRSGASLPGPGGRFERLAAVVAFLRDRTANVFAYLLPRFIPVFGPSMAAFNLLNHLADGERALVLEVTRALPRNVTTEMDLGLWKAAAAIRADGTAQAFFRQASAQALAHSYLDGSLSPVAQTAIGRFMERYGMRGVGEIDFGQPCWREDPTPLMHTLKSYLEIDAASAPDVLFARGEQAAQAAIAELAAAIRRQPAGRFKSRLALAAARRIRTLMGARESPKFMAIRTMGIARLALLAVGQEFAAAGTIDCPDDLVFLSLAELDALAVDEPHDWQPLVAERRAAFDRELRRRQVPRVLVSDGRAFYEGLGAPMEAGLEGEAITGSPVSPGVVEGVAHVVLDPRGVQLAPGEILVCPGTDPAWTPLFMTAGGLVTEVGGMMTHGSVVAREYGIPAVVSVHRATERIRTGQRIRVDGTSGTIILQ